MRRLSSLWPLDCFNPHPPRRAGATSCQHQSKDRSPSKFQSSPASKGGCYLRLLGGVQEIEGVSILTRLEGRVLQRGRCLRGFDSPVSILTRLEGRVLLRNCTRYLRDIWFQSSPASKGGCYGADAGHHHQRPEGVSILTRLEGRVLPVLEGDVECVVVGFNPHPPRRAGATSTYHDP